MGNYNFDEIISREGTNSVKLDGARRGNPLLREGFIPMGVADMDFACPEPILAAMRARLDQRILGYSEPYEPAYFAALDGWMHARHGFHVEPWQAETSEGVVRAMEVAVRLLTSPNDKVLMNTPGYGPFERAAITLDRGTVCSPLIETDGAFGFDWEDMERKAADPAVKLYFLCNPHNPTGRVWTESELRRVADLMFAHGVYVFSDEIWGDHTRAGVRHTSLAALYPGKKGYVVATAPSKTFNIAGNGLANLIFPDREMAERWRGTCGSPNPLSIEACRAAYAECGDWADAMRAYIDGNFAAFAEGLKRYAPKTRMTVPEGTYLAWVDVSGCGLTGEQAEERIARENVCVQAGSHFIGNGEGRIRVNLACPRALIEEAVRRIGRALEK